MKALRLILLLPLLLAFSAHADTYYVSIHGSDKNVGTSPEKPWRSIARVNQHQYRAGDTILFAAAQKFMGQLTLANVIGTKENPITVTTYGGGDSIENAHLDAGLQRNAVLVLNSQHVHLKHLSISAATPLPKKAGKGFRRDMRVGVLIKIDDAATQQLYSGFVLHDLHIRDVFYYPAGHQRGGEDVKTANGTQHYGWGIRVINNRPKVTVKDININQTTVSNVAHTGIKFTSRYKQIHNITVTNSRVYQTGGPGIQLGGVIDGRIANNNVSYSGSPNDSRKWGRGSGLWTWSSERILIEGNHFTHAHGPADSAGVHIDFNCQDIIVQYNFSAHNAGGFYEVLGNNYNTAYRYNISVNDGARVKGVNDAFQEGKTFWLSGYNGKNERSGPFNSYFYNNTIYVAEHMVSKVAIDKRANGVFVANNIFHVVKPAAYVKGDQYKPDDENNANNSDVFFQNNLFLNTHSWPSEAPIKDAMPVIGDAQFAAAGGDQLADYTPTNRALVKNKGLWPKALSQDPKGLYLGLTLSHDILGNPVTDEPDMGAIELP